MAKGLPAPAFSQPTPRSCIRDDPLEEQPQDPIWQVNPVSRYQNPRRSLHLSFQKYVGAHTIQQCIQLDPHSDRIPVTGRVETLDAVFSSIEGALRSFRTDAVQCISG